MLTGGGLASRYMERNSGGEVVRSEVRCVMYSAPVLAANAIYATCRLRFGLHDLGFGVWGKGIRVCRKRHVCHLLLTVGLYDFGFRV